MEDSGGSNEANMFHARRYELLEELGDGRGTSGDVWRARDTHLNREVALKILHSRALDKAWTEASVLTRLSGPNIVPVHNADVDVDTPFIDTQLITSGTVADAIHPYGVPEWQATQWTTHLLTGLDHCHRVGLLHNDIKPENVFLTPQGVAQLGDFGCATSADGGTKGQGDPNVRAPEVLKGAPMSIRSDVYSTGITLRAMLTGSLPYSIADLGGFPALKAEVAKGLPPIRDVAPHVGQGLGSIVTKATSAKPADRYATADEFKRALARLPNSAKSFTRRVAPHTGHHSCWTVTRKGKADLNVCVIPDGQRFSIETKRRTGGRRVKDCCTTNVTRSKLPAMLRAVFKDAP